MSDYKVLKKTIAKHGNVMDFYECEVGLPDGSRTYWDLIKHPGGAAVLPIDEDGNFIMVRQYRIGADRELIEIPAGKADKNESPIDTIKREMEEEIGYVSDDISKLMVFYPAPAYSEECTVIYAAWNLRKTEARPDDDEYIDILRISPDDAVSMIKSGEIVDGKTIAAVMTYMT